MKQFSKHQVYEAEMTDSQIKEVEKTLEDIQHKIKGILEPKIDKSEGEMKEALLKSYNKLVLPDYRDEKYK